MIKLLVNTPGGYQEIITVHETGGYNDKSAVVWDEREQGPIPANLELPVLQAMKMREQAEQDAIQAKQETKKALIDKAAAYKTSDLDTVVEMRQALMELYVILGIK